MALELLRSQRSKVPKSDEHVDWSKQGVKKLTSEVLKIASKTRVHEPPKILFIGETGSGKSSFISSIVSALQGKIIYTSTVGEKEGHEVNTSKRYQEHRVFMEDEDARKGTLKSQEVVRRKESPLNFVLCDSRGLAKRNQQGAADEEIERLIDGKLRHGDLIEDERSYDGTRISDREPKPPCCVVFVQKAQRLGDMDADVKDKLHRASMLVRERGIPSCVVLTHIDKIKPSLETKLHLALTSVKIHQRVKIAAQEAGVNENRVFVVKNYTKEQRTHTRHDVLILRALQGILVDVEQRDRDKYEHIRQSSYQSSDSGVGSSMQNLSAVDSSFLPAGPSSDLGSGPSTSVSRRDERARKKDDGVLKSHEWIQDSVRRHHRQSSVHIQPYPPHDVLKHSYSSEEMPRQHDYYIRFGKSSGSSRGSKEDSKSDEQDYTSEDPEEDSLLQQYTSRLQEYQFPDHYTEKVELKGARPFYRPTVLQLRNSIITASDEAGLCSQLTKEADNNSSLFERVMADLQHWSGATTGAVWMSDTLPMDLSLPLQRYLPDSVLAQALFLAPGLPAFLLSVIDPERVLESQEVLDKVVSKTLQEEEPENVIDITTQMCKLLTAALFNYCHCDFILLPVVVNDKEFCANVMEKEIRKQQDSSRSYFGGPRRLSQKTYAELCAAATALCGVSHVPTLLHDLDPGSTEIKRRFTPSADAAHEDRVYLLDSDWRGTVSLLIQNLAHTDEQMMKVTYKQTCYFKMMAALIEAAKRLSFVEDVAVVTADKHVQECCQRLKVKVQESTGLELKLNTVVLHSRQPRPDFKATILILIDMPDLTVSSDAIVLHVVADQSSGLYV